MICAEARVAALMLSFAESRSIARWHSHTLVRRVFFCKCPVIEPHLPGPLVGGSDYFGRFAFDPGNPTQKPGPQIGHDRCEGSSDGS
jgi:hypothetical protein